MQYFSFQWHITEDCDQRCKHCYTFSGGQKKKIDEMNFEQMMITLNNIEDFCRTFQREPYIFLTGGDPVLHKDFWRLMDEFKKRKISFTIMGNPFHLTTDVCKKLKESGCVRYQLSLDGTRETHDWFRMPGSFDITLKKIKTIKNAGIRAIIMTTVSDKNIDEIPDVIDIVVESGADVFSFGRYVPSGSEDDKTNGITPIRYRKLLDTCYKKYQKYNNDGENIYFHLKDHLFTLYEYEEGYFEIPKDADPEIIYGGCNCADSHITILPTGEVYACRRVKESKVGSVYEDKLSSLWINQMEEYRQFDKFSKCSKCKLLAWCRGCPAVAKGTNGSFYSEDPQCWL